MENSSSSLTTILGTAIPRSGTAGDPYLAGGFLIGSSLLGLLVIIGTFWYHRSNLSLFKRSCVMTITSQDYRLRSIQIIHRSLVSLLIMDALNLIVAIILGAEMFVKFCYDEINCFHTEIIWSLSRWFGVIIHLLSASLSICHLCHQLLSLTRVHIVCSLIGVLFGIIIALYVYVPEVAQFTLAVFMFVLALAVILEFRVPTLSPSTATLKKLIMLAAIFNFLVVYVPTFTLQCLSFCPCSFGNFVNYRIAYVNIQVFTNLHLIFDGFLCALVLKLPSGEEQQQQHHQLQELTSSSPRHTASPIVNQQ